MQTLVQVVCTRGPSLREAIVKHRRLEDYGLRVSLQQQPGRSHGWAKVHSSESDRRGVLNIEWDADTCLLLCRVVSRGQTRPNLPVGSLVDFLLRHFRSRVEAINIIPR